MKNITKEEWTQLVAEDANAVIVDVRTPGECQSGIQPNAIQLDLMNHGAFSQGIQDFDKSKNYYVYCRSGNRSQMACGMMDGLGLKTYNLIGGMMFWDGALVRA